MKEGDRLEIHKEINNKTLNAKKTINSKLRFLQKQWAANKYVYIMLIPVIAFYIIFHYGPMYGLLMAFQSTYSPVKGITGGDWVGFKYFIQFFKSFFFFRLMKNTILLSIYSIIFSFPAPIILALLINELKGKLFKRITQTVSYLPHFLSVVVIAGMIQNFTAKTGLINNIRLLFDAKPILFMSEADWFRPIYIISGIWQGAGWGSIIFLAALSNIDMQQYEAAKIDGAGRLRQLWNITLPGILPTIVIMLILRLGAVMSSDMQKILLLQSPATYETSDVISTFVYRQGILNGDYNYSTAIGLFNSIINFIFLLLSNKISQKLNETSLW